MKLLPPSKPKRPEADIVAVLQRHNVDLTKCSMLAVRGYYRDSMGEPGVNDRGIYDDALFVYSPNTFTSFNFNVDPSRIRNGHGAGALKGMASLKPGVWLYEKGIHKTYEAFVQAERVVVIRDGTPPYYDSGWFGINIHRGGISTTSSLGCQTIYPSQWISAKELIYSEMTRCKHKTIQYCLVDQAETGWNT